MQLLGNAYIEQWFFVYVKFKFSHISLILSGICRLSQLIFGYKWIKPEKKISKATIDVCAQLLSCVWLFCNPINCSPPGFVHEIFQARNTGTFYTSWDRLNSGIKRVSLTSPTLTGKFFTTAPPWKHKAMMSPPEIPLCGFQMVGRV